MENTNSVIKIERVTNNRWGNPQFQVFFAKKLSDKLRKALNDKFETHKVKANKTSPYESENSIYLVGYFKDNKDMHDKINAVVSSVKE